MPSENYINIPEALLSYALVAQQVERMAVILAVVLDFTDAVWKVTMKSAVRVCPGALVSSHKLAAGSIKIFI